MGEAQVKTSIFVLAATLALGLAACGDKSEGTGKTLATVNGQDIRESLVNDQLKQIPANLLQGREANVRQQVLEGIIQQALLKQEAKKENITGQEAYKTQLAAIEAQLQANLLLSQKVSETVTTDKLRQAYEANKAKLAFPAVKAKHVLVPAEAQARDLIKIATPANFSELAKQYSKGPSAESGGELGWFRREAMIPEFAALAFSTPVGTVATTPVKTQFGWHVILVEDRNEQYVPPFEQVEPQLRQELSQSAAQQFLQDLRKKATVTYSDGAGVSPTEAPKS